MKYKTTKVRITIPEARCPCCQFSRSEMKREMCDYCINGNCGEEKAKYLNRVSEGIL